jgi:hypothetical protein
MSGPSGAVISLWKGPREYSSALPHARASLLPWACLQNHCGQGRCGAGVQAGHPIGGRRRPFTAGPGRPVGAARWWASVCTHDGGAPTQQAGPHLNQALENLLPDNQLFEYCVCLYVYENCMYAYVCENPPLLTRDRDCKRRRKGREKITQDHKPAWQSRTGRALAQRPGGV